MSKFHERINSLKDNCGETQAKIAENLGITPQALSYYLKGREPKYDLLIKMAEYFDCTTDYLLGLSDYKNAAIVKRLNIENENLVAALKKHASSSFNRSGYSAFELLANLLDSELWFWVIMSELNSYIHFDKNNNEYFKTIFIDKQEKVLTGTHLEIPQEHVLDYILVSAQNHLRYLFEELRADKLKKDSDSK